jgi:hypothetical protein
VDFVCVVGTMCHRPLGGAVDVPEILAERRVGSTDHRLKSWLVWKSFPPPELLVLPSVPRPWGGQGSKQRLQPDIARSSPLGARRRF